MAFKSLTGYRGAAEAGLPSVDTDAKTGGVVVEPERKRKMANESVRNSILDAVSRVVARDGLVNTTIDAIAAEAGVSKGGVLYYFSSKKALLLGMVDRYEAGFLERRRKVIESLPDTPQRLLKATVTLMLQDMEASRDETPNFGTVLDDPEVCKRVGEFKKRVFKEVCAGLADQEAVALVMYAVDGMWMDLRFTTMVVSRKRRSEAMRELIKYIDTLEGK